MTELAREERRASKSGYHFINLYQQCPRKWWIHYALGLVPVKIGKALIYGKAWHEACAKYLATQDTDAAMALGLAELEASIGEYQYVDDAAVDKVKFRKVFPFWVVFANRLLTEYNVLEVEVEHSATLASGAKMTMRLDGVLQHKYNKAIYVSEHKTTSYSFDNMVKTVDAQDQATAYLWGLGRSRPDLAPLIRGVLLDVSYVRVAKGTVSDTVLVDSAIIHRTKRDLAEFEISMSGLFQELGQKYLAWKTGRYPVPLLFPRNGSSCSMFGCEYEGICRSTLTPGMPIGSDYEWDPLVGQDDEVLRKLAEKPLGEATSGA